MLEIAKKIKQAGGTLYLVGGAIRNQLLNMPVIDEDYCVTGLSKEQFQILFPEAKIQGKDFPVFILNQKEIALARKERKIGKGHKEFEFLTSPEITIEEDLARRDITINSIAQDILTGEIIDPFRGRDDIQKRILRKTTDAFSEDPLRVYRVARLMTTLYQPLEIIGKEEQFIVEVDTLKAMEQLKIELLTLSKERVFCEFRKAISSQKPSIFFETLRKAKVLEVHFPEIANLIGQTQPEKHHPEGDSYQHTMIAVDNSAKLTSNLAIRFSCLVHDLGKGVTPKEMLPHHYGHEEKGVKLVQSLGNKIGVPNSWIKCGKIAAKWHMKGGIFEKMTAKKQVELIENIDKSMLGLQGLKIVVACDKSRYQEDLQETFKQIKFATLAEQCLQQVTGDKIRKQYPNLIGKQFGEKLHQERINWIKSIDRK